MAERKEKLKELLARLKRGGIVQNRDLRTWLGEEAYAAYQAEWAEQIEIRALLKVKPEDISTYEQLLRKAQIFENRAAAANARSRQQSAQVLFAKAQAGYDLALEFLEEAVAADPSLTAWLDRAVKWSPQECRSLCAVDMPRAITSRRGGIRGGGWRGALLTKRELKVTILMRAIENGNAMP